MFTFHSNAERFEFKETLFSSTVCLQRSIISGSDQNRLEPLNLFRLRKQRKTPQIKDDRMRDREAELRR